MRLTSKAIRHQQRIADLYAFGNPDTKEHMVLGANTNPDLSWADIPPEAKSLVLLCVDSDVPSVPDGINEENKSIAHDLPRVDFYHWVMVDIPAEDGAIAEGSCSDGVVAHGKSDPSGPEGSRQGINDYTSFLADNPKMQGDYFGYDGPCPPWNDERLHHYHFVLYATDLERCPVSGRFTGGDVRAAIDGHVLAQARLTGTYSLNPAVG